MLSNENKPSKKPVKSVHYKRIALLEKIPQDEKNFYELNLYDCNIGASIEIFGEYLIVLDKDYYTGEDGAPWVEYQIQNVRTLKQGFLSVVVDEDNMQEVWLEIEKPKIPQDIHVTVEDLNYVDETLESEITYKGKRYVFKQSYLAYFQEEKESQKKELKYYEYLAGDSSLMFERDEFDTVKAYISKEVQADDISVYSLGK